MELRLWYQSPVGTLSGSGELVVALLRCLWRMRRTPDHHTASRLVQELTRGVPSMTRKQVSQREATGSRVRVCPWARGARRPGPYGYESVQGREGPGPYGYESVTPGPSFYPK